MPTLTSLVEFYVEIKASRIDEIFLKKKGGRFALLHVRLLINLY